MKLFVIYVAHRNQCDIEWHSHKQVHLKACMKRYFVKIKWSVFFATVSPGEGVPKGRCRLLWENMRKGKGRLSTSQSISLSRILRRIKKIQIQKWLIDILGLPLPGKLGISINYCILCDSFLCLQAPLRSQRRHTLQHLNAAVKKCHPHILSAWAWHLTSPSSTTRSGTAQMQPANWLNKYAKNVNKIFLVAVFSVVLCGKCSTFFFLTGIWWCHCRAGPAMWGFLQRQHSHHAAPQRQPDSECLLSHGTQIHLTVTRVLLLMQLLCWNSHTTW